MSALYNENDKYAAQWIRNLVAAGHIAPGAVDERSIKDLTAADVVGGGQRHFFAGVGVWSLALRLAGWGDDEDIWTGSCPCQPWSGAGKKKGKLDERHLWPDWFKLIGQRRPRRIVGEQVASPAGLAWLDDVQTDLEGAGYAFAAFDLCSAGFGAPHQRQRLYFAALADSNSSAGGQGREESGGSNPRSDAPSRDGSRRDGGAGRGVAHATQLKGRLPADSRRTDTLEARGSGKVGRLVNSAGRRWSESRLLVAGHHAATGTRPDDQHSDAGTARGLGHTNSQHAGRDSGAGDRAAELRAISDAIGASGATRGHWAGADWLPCRDGFWRAVEPGTFPLAHGAPQRVGRLRAYGNAIDAHLAAQFLGALKDSLGGAA